MIKLPFRNGGWSRYRLLCGEGQSKAYECTMTTDLSVKSWATVSCTHEWDKIKVAIWYTLDGFVRLRREQISIASYVWFFPRTRTGLRKARLLTAIIKSALDLQMVSDITTHRSDATTHSELIPSNSAPLGWGTLKDEAPEIVNRVNQMWQSALESLNENIKGGELHENR